MLNVQDDRTPGRNYAKPNPANPMRSDVVRIAQTLDSVDGDITGLLSLTDRLTAHDADHEARVAMIEKQRRLDRLRTALGLSSLSA